MRKLLAALAGILGIAWLRRRRQQPVEPAVDPAEELRAKLAQTREAEPEPEPEAPEPEQDVAARRQDVHDRARAAIDDLAGGE
jgi:hypothetical protein